MAQLQSLTYYDLLEVAPNASVDEIRTAYRRLARSLHPDVTSQPGAEVQMRHLNEAYAVLSDPRQRVAYDESLEDGQSPLRRRMAPTPPQAWTAPKPRAQAAPLLTASPAWMRRVSGTHVSATVAARRAVASRRRTLTNLARQDIQRHGAMRVTITTVIAILAVVNLLALVLLRFVLGRGA